jgi:NAD(P)-dependent dehydrogenase (short-subunit alcohol dehydrogenase family)
MAKKTFLVTGAYGGIGKAICEILAKDLNHQIILAGRNERELNSTVEQIKSQTKNTSIQGYVVDFSSKVSIENFALQLNDQPINVLINNHATGPAKRELTKDGIEVQFATNVLGYIWMINSFENNLKKCSPNARIVNVASYWAGGLDINDLEFQKRRYTTDDAYRQSKQANRMLTLAYAEKFLHDGITVNVCHPGDSNTKLSNSMGFGGHETPEQSAQTPVYLAISNDVANITGKYFRDCKIQTDQFMKDKELIKKLFDICQKY